MPIKKKSTELVDTIQSSLQEDPHRGQTVWESGILEYSVKCQKRINKSEPSLTHFCSRGMEMNTYVSQIIYSGTTANTTCRPYLNLMATLQVGIEPCTEYILSLLSGGT